MNNISDHRIKILLDLGLEKEANKLKEITDLKTRDIGIYSLICQYLKSSDFQTSLTLGKTIKNQELKELILQIIFKVYIRQNLSNNLSQEIDINLLQRIKKNIKRINEKSLPKLNQRTKVINLTLGAEIHEVREILERIATRDIYLAVTILIDILNLGNNGFRVLLKILIHSENNELKQICYHLFKHQGGKKTQEKIKSYKPDTTIIIINGEENYTFKKVKQGEKITYQRIEEWEKYHLPNFMIPQVKIVNQETFRQLFLPYTFIVFAQPNPFLLTHIKKDIYLNKIPIIYPHIEGQNLPENLMDNLIKLYQPSVHYLQKVSGKTIAQMKANKAISPAEIETKIRETEQNISLFIDDMLAQI